MTTQGTMIGNRGTLKQAMDAAREGTDGLFGMLIGDAFLERPVPERHRFVFYLGHLEAFDLNLLVTGAARRPAFHPRFDRLFAFGIDPIDGGLPDEPASAWPPVSEILAYRDRARRAVDEVIEEIDPPVDGFGGGRLAEVALEHRLMHAETLAYLMHALPHGMKRPPATAAPVASTKPGAAVTAAREVTIPAGTATLGLDLGKGRFGWDNEFVAHAVEVPSFAIDARNVTNREFLEFVASGGYERRDLWKAADREWRERGEIRHPFFWIRRSGAWRFRGMFEETPLPLDHPVLVSHAEAEAYARFAGGRLPTEAEFHRAAFGTPEGSERSFPWGEAPPGPEHGNFDFRWWETAPAGSFPEGAGAFGVHDLLGNGWEWTSTIFGPFDGFEPFPFYRGYSADFFDGRHYVLKGGSPRTAARLLRRSFRNWFQPHYRHAYTSFRLVRS